MAGRVGQWDSGLMNIYCSVSLTSCVVLTQEHYIVGCAYESLRAFFYSSIHLVLINKGRNVEQFTTTFWLYSETYLN